MLKVSIFYLEKQKSFIPKENICQYKNEKALFTDPIFSEGFGCPLYKIFTYVWIFILDERPEKQDMA